ncbi:MAG: hypothetical protein IBX44_05310 [Sulfurospirillum sp.]|nr:hypothetical protein [Sulfurospirillum sp.]
MCVMHAPINTNVPQVARREKQQHEERKPFDKRLLKADPKFIDERKTVKERKEQGFFEKLFGL